MKIDNAIILAAGKGERLRPYTDTTPKPLLPINNKPIIEYTIELLKSKNINEIEIVVGYLKEQFEYLTKKYDNIRLIENPAYLNTNNISGVYCVKEFLHNTVILDGDILINNPNVILSDVSHAFYTCFYANEFLNEWYVELDDKDKIINCHRNGYPSGYVVRSIVYLTEKESEKLKVDIEKCLVDEGMTKLYYDDVLLFNYKEDFEMYCHKIDSSDLIEFDETREYEQYKEVYNA